MKIDLFKNSHLSVSRLRLYELCQLAFYYQYVEKGPKSARTGFAAELGTILHAALELAFQWIVSEEYSGEFPTEKLIEFYREAWQAGALPGVDLYREGLSMLRTFALSHGPVDCMKILAVEQEFNVDLGGFTVNGYIDRVDKTSDDAIEIVDYKSSRKLYVQQELESDLQMSVYGLAARVLYPWAKKVTFVFSMLRHNKLQRAPRTAQQIDDTAGYVVALGKRTETDKEWKATLNENCGYCDHRGRCPEYAEALKGNHDVAKANREDWSDLVREREKVASLGKIMYGRRGELDKFIAKRLEEEGPFESGGRSFQFGSNTWGDVQVTYPAEGVRRAFEQAGITVDLDLAPVTSHVETLFQHASTKLSASMAMILRANLDAISEKAPMKQVIDSRAIKKK